MYPGSTGARAIRYILAPFVTVARRLLDLVALIAPGALIALLFALLVSAFTEPVIPITERLYTFAWRGHSSIFYLFRSIERRRTLRICRHASVAIVYSTDCKNALYAESAAGDPALQDILERQARVLWARK